MPKPYMDPAMRRKMGMDAPAPAAPASPMDESEGGMGDGQAEESKEGSQPTAFLPKEMGGGKQWKPGDEIVLKIDAVDPETGELQVSYAPEKADEPAGDSSPMETFDKTMPEDQQEGY
jgi:hypothetical protein